MCQLKVKCPIPSRIKECGKCDNYLFPFIVTTSEGETVKEPPKCRGGCNLATQKAPCPAFKNRISSIFVQGNVKVQTADDLLKFRPVPPEFVFLETARSISRTIDDTGREYFKAIGVEFTPDEITRRLEIEISRRDEGNETYIVRDKIRHVLVMIWEFNNYITGKGRMDGVFRFAPLKDCWEVER